MRQPAPEQGLGAMRQRKLTLLSLTSVCEKELIGIDVSAICRHVIWSRYRGLSVGSPRASYAQEDVNLQSLVPGARIGQNSLSDATWRPFGCKAPEVLEISLLTSSGTHFDTRAPNLSKYAF